jgi:putative restriction endonuclease
LILLVVVCSELVLAQRTERIGQGTFRARLLDAYGRRCAITGERTEPVLDAAHIQPYLGPRSNHIRNGLVLSKEFHTLFDLGYVGIDPDYRVHVSPRLYEEWHNGRRYYEYDDRPLVQLPEVVAERPSPAALEWHLGKRFLG